MVDQRDLPPHVTLPLLSLVTAQSLDGDYQHVANRKDAAGERRTSPRALRNAAIIVAIFGLMTVVAFVQTERNAEDTEAGRQRLISSITAQRDVLAQRQARISELRTQTRALSADVERVADAESSATSGLLGIKAHSGYAPVSGPGVRVRLSDSPSGGVDGRVYDEDLAMLVNGLWVAGAEAIAVNGHRLTSQTGIRNVGLAIHIKAQPLKPPYIVQAVGNPNTMQSLFIESRPGVEFNALRSAYGFEFEMENAQNLNIPASQGPRLRSAEVFLTRSEKEMEVRR